MNLPQHLCGIRVERGAADIMSELRIESGFRCRTLGGLLDGLVCIAMLRHVVDVQLHRSDNELAMAVGHDELDL